MDVRAVRIDAAQGCGDVRGRCARMRPADEAVHPFRNARTAIVDRWSAICTPRDDRCRRRDRRDRPCRTWRGCRCRAKRMRRGGVTADVHQRNAMRIDLMRNMGYLLSVPCRFRSSMICPARKQTRPRRGYGQATADFCRPIQRLNAGPRFRCIRFIPARLPGRPARAPPAPPPALPALRSVRAGRRRRRRRACAHPQVPARVPASPVRR